jgi:hypothetical protein
MWWSGGVALLVIFGGGGPGTSRWEHPDFQDFKRRIGIATAPGIDAQDGVAADWTKLPAAIAKHLGGMRLRPGTAFPSEPGLAETSFSWSKARGSLSIEVWISGTGPRAARDRLLLAASATNMMKIPYQRGPEGLGDFAVQHAVPGSAAIYWTFRNACVHVRRDGPGSPSVEPIARAIQSFMERHLVPTISEHVPKAEAAGLFPRMIHVGDEVRLSVRLAKELPAESIMTHFVQDNERLLQEQHVELLSTTYSAEKLGRGHIDVLIADRKTLLSPALTLEFDVLPRSKGGPGPR